tara:strand:+ start:22 stop:846 length:825 start_codon:yes stop_codon:yes gene_type:complete
MFGNYFYNKNIRNIVILFGTVFNNIGIRRTDAAGVVQEEFKVPIAYGPAEKFLVRLRQGIDKSKGQIGLTLPRMSFEFTAITYDSGRKQQSTKRFKKVKVGDATAQTSVYNPVPYNFDFNLSVMVKNSDDGSQILEQILPYFTPEYQVTMNEMSTMGIKRDIPIIFTGLSTEDNYEGDFLTRRAIIHTLTFTVQGYMYGPVGDIGIVRTVIVDSSLDAAPELDYQTKGFHETRMTKTPKALTDINEDEVINAADDALVTPDHDYGFNETYEDIG